MNDAPLDNEGEVDILKCQMGQRPPRMAEDDPRQYIAGGDRLAVGVCPWMGDAGAWWVGTSPRNGDGASVEGLWQDWVALARGILAADEEARAKGYVQGGSPGAEK